MYNELMISMSLLISRNIVFEFDPLQLSMEFKFHRIYIYYQWNVYNDTNNKNRYETISVPFQAFVEEQF